MRKFDIRRQGGKARASGVNAMLYTTIGRTRPPLHIYVCSKVEVNVKNWMALTRGRTQTKLFDWYTNDEEGKRIYAKLRQIDKVIDDVLKEPGAMSEDCNAYNVDYIKTQIAYKIDAIVSSERKEEIDNAVKKFEEQRAKDENQFLPYMRKYIEGINNDTKLNQGQPYASNSKRNWRAFGVVMEVYHKKHPFRWEDVNKNFMDKLIRYFIDCGYSASTRNKHIIYFQKIVKDAKEEGYHDQRGTETLIKDKKCRVTGTNKKTMVYLTEDELESLYNMPLEGHFAVHRDAFLVGCYTCTAYAEFSRISGKFIVDSDGVKVLRIHRQKTGTLARIETNLPFRHNHLVEILQRYNFDMESLRLYDTHINEDLKVILKELSKDVPSLATPFETMLTKTEKAMVKAGKMKVEKNVYGKVIKRKYDMVSTHTARRSGITNLLLTGKYSIFDLKNIAGHTDVNQTIDYIKLSGEEVSEFIERHTELNNNIIHH